MFLCRVSKNLFVFSSPKNNCLAKFHPFRAERQTMEDIRFWARFWKHKSPGIDFRSFCNPNRTKRPKRVLDAKVQNFAKICDLLLRRRSFCAHRENHSVANAFYLFCSPFSPFPKHSLIFNFFVKSDSRSKYQF